MDLINNELIKVFFSPKDFIEGMPTYAGLHSSSASFMLLILNFAASLLHCDVLEGLHPSILRCTPEMKARAFNVLLAHFDDVSAISSVITMPVGSQL